MYIRDHNEELAPLRFLFVDYKCNKWWFEIADMYRRIIFLGIVPLISPNSATRASFGCMLAIMSVAYYREEQPYRVEFTNVIAHIAQFSILITIYGALTIETSSMVDFGLEDYKLGVFLLLLNLIISVLAFWLAYSSLHKAKTQSEQKELKAATSEDARSFSENKFNTTFAAIWKHSVPASHTLVFHYTSAQLAVRARKSGIAAQQRFNGVPLSLRYPYGVSELDFDVFDDSNTSDQSERLRLGTNPEKKKFPNEEVLVLSLPSQYLDPLPGYEDDDGLCMISAQVLHAMRSTSFTAVVDSQPWINGFALLPPHCILRSFLIMNKSSQQRHLSVSKSIYSPHSTAARKASTSVSGSSGAHRHSRFQSSSSSSSSSPYRKSSVDLSDTSPVHDISFAVKARLNSVSPHKDHSIQSGALQLVMLNSIETYVGTMSKLRQKAFGHNLTLLYHYTSLNVAKLIIEGGLRMSTQGQGDGGVYVSTQGPASYGLGTDDYEVNIIKDCFGVERIDEYEGKGKLDVIIVYACETSVLTQAPGGRENAKMFSKSTFVDFSLQHDNGSFFLRPDRIFGAFHVDPRNLPLMSGDSAKEMIVERNREHQVIEKLQAAEMKHHVNTARIEKKVSFIWSLMDDLTRKIAEDVNNEEEEGSIGRFGVDVEGGDIEMSGCLSPFPPPSPLLPPPPTTTTVNFDDVAEESATDSGSNLSSFTTATASSNNTILRGDGASYL
jgi:hypothetical protein